MRHMLVIVVACFIAGCNNKETDDTDIVDESMPGGDIPTQIIVDGSNNIVTVDMDIYVLQPNSEDSRQTIGGDYNP